MYGWCESKVNAIALQFLMCWCFGMIYALRPHPPMVTSYRCFLGNLSLHIYGR